MSAREAHLVFIVPRGPRLTGSVGRYCMNAYECKPQRSISFNNAGTCTPRSVPCALSKVVLDVCRWAACRPLSAPCSAAQQPGALQQNLSDSGKAYAGPRELSGFGLLDVLWGALWVIFLEIAEV